MVGVPSRWKHYPEIGVIDMKVFRIVFRAALAALCIWLGFSFMSWSFNPGMWEEPARLTAGVMWFGVLALVSFMETEL